MEYFSWGRTRDRTTAILPRRRHAERVSLLLKLNTVEIKFYQDVSAGKPMAASAKIF
jgi:hypothetical protein